MIISPNLSLPFESHSLEDTRRFGHTLASLLKPGDVLGIVGDLGAGKTQIVKAICGAWGIPEETVTSPTFTLVHEYAAKDRRKIAHADLYRLETRAEFESLDLTYYLDEGAILLVEWADKFWSLLPGIPKRLDLRISGEHTRQIQYFLKGNGRKELGKLF